ncbi:hypothetical protein [Nocardia brasiliensis]|uniref:hypothetical protein n=1 Tax=Nocardia brasiliensis TaxID=37326 RepID=UPI00245483E3|nr:hypothetical protein [Nocardia brasiliensis]
MNDDYDQFDSIHTPAELSEALARFDIMLRSAAGTITYWPDECGELWKEIGRVVLWEKGRLIELWPYCGTSAEDLDVLRGAGVAAHGQDPSVGDHWAQRHNHTAGEYWECVLSVPAMHDDPQVRVIRAAETFHDRQDREFTERYGTHAA